MKFNSLKPHKHSYLHLCIMEH